jgi:hypothetical protein
MHAEGGTKTAGARKSSGHEIHWLRLRWRTLYQTMPFIIIFKSIIPPAKPSLGAESDVHAFYIRHRHGQLCSHSMMFHRQYLDWYSIKNTLRKNITTNINTGINKQQSISNFLQTLFTVYPNKTRYFGAWPCIHLHEDVICEVRVIKTFFWSVAFRG